MELTYQREMQLPTHYACLSEEEMTYIEGGEYSFQVGDYIVHINPDALVNYALNIGINVVYLLGMAATSAAVTGVIKGYHDGLTLGQTVSHFWGRQTTGGRIAAVAVGAMAGFYIYSEAMDLYNSAVSVIDSINQALNSDQTTATTAAAA